MAVRAAAPEFRLEVIVRESGFELTNGETLIAALPKSRRRVRLRRCSRSSAVQLKRENPEVTTRRC